MLRPLWIDMAQVQHLLESSRYRIALAKTDRFTVRESIDLTHRAIRDSLDAMERSDRMMDQSPYFTDAR